MDLVVGRYSPPTGCGAPASPPSSSSSKEVLVLWRGVNCVSVPLGKEARRGLGVGPLCWTSAGTLFSWRGLNLSKGRCSPPKGAPPGGSKPPRCAIFSRDKALNGRRKLIKFDELDLFVGRCSRPTVYGAPASPPSSSSVSRVKREKPGQRRAPQQARQPSAARCRLSHRESLVKRAITFGRQLLTASSKKD